MKAEMIQIERVTAALTAPLLSRTSHVCMAMKIRPASPMMIGTRSWFDIPNSSRLKVSRTDLLPNSETQLDYWANSALSGLTFKKLVSQKIQGSLLTSDASIEHSRTIPGRYRTPGEMK